jgi:predicted enzyme related to lactoylglutathione lyase
MNNSTKTPTNALNGFEIPVRDLDRAQRLYEALLNRPLQREASNRVGLHAAG